jgi:hypothetical protein
MSEETDGTAQQIFDFFVEAGFTPEQAAGVVANVEAESGFNPKGRGDGGLAHGLFQMHPDRCEAIERGTGINMLAMPDVEEQCKGALWEMHNPEAHAYRIMMTATTAYQAGYDMCRYYERPFSEEEWDKRGDRATYWFGELSHVPDPAESAGSTETLASTEPDTPA